MNKINNKKKIFKIGLFLTILIIFVIMGIKKVTVSTAPFGKYVGSVNVTLLDDGRKIKLLNDFIYIDPENVIWKAPAGCIVDGASIPRIVWPIIGGPLTGKYRNASIIHDVACEKKERPWEAVHIAFHNAMRLSGINETVAKIIYGAVYWFGPNWPTKITKIVYRLNQESTIKAEIAEYSRSNITHTVKSVKYSKSLFITSIQKVIPDHFEKVKIEFIITPSKQKINEKDFMQLKKAIHDGDLSLEDIRKFNFK